MVGFEEQLCLLHTFLSNSTLNGAVRILEWLTLKVDVIFVGSILIFFFFLQIFCSWRIYNNVNQLILLVPSISFCIEFVFSKRQVCTFVTYSLYSSQKILLGILKTEFLPLQCFPVQSRSDACARKCNIVILFILLHAHPESSALTHLDVGVPVGQRIQRQISCLSCLSWLSLWFIRPEKNSSCENKKGTTKPEHLNERTDALPWATRGYNNTHCSLMEWMIRLWTIWSLPRKKL